MRMQHEILDKLAALPGVISVGFAKPPPLESFLGGAGNPVYAEDKTLTEGQVPRSGKSARSRRDSSRRWERVLLRDATSPGPTCTRNGASPSCRRIWRGSGGAIRVRRSASGFAKPARPIPGAKSSASSKTSTNGVNVKPPEFAYWPALMDRYIWGGDNGFAVGSGMFAIRSSRTGTEGLLTEAQQAIWSVNGRQPVFLVNTLKALYDQSMARTSFTLVMLAIAGGMALVIGIVGIYGVIAYVVSQRTREIGIRTALGAQPAELLGMFVRHGLLLAGIGAALGLVAAAGLTRLMSSLLFGVTALDPVTYAAVSALLVAAAVLGELSSRAPGHCRDPVQALRAE